eukprot:1988804-Rhodomonas_salina.3
MRMSVCRSIAELTWAPLALVVGLYRLPRLVAQTRAQYKTTHRTYYIIGTRIRRTLARRKGVRGRLYPDVLGAAGDGTNARQDPLSVPLSVLPLGGRPFVRRAVAPPATVLGAQRNVPGAGGGGRERVPRGGGGGGTPGCRLRRGEVLVAAYATSVPRASVLLGHRRYKGGSGTWRRSRAERPEIWKFCGGGEVLWSSEEAEASSGPPSLSLSVLPARFLSRLCSGEPPSAAAAAAAAWSRVTSA